MTANTPGRPGQNEGGYADAVAYVDPDIDPAFDRDPQGKIAELVKIGPVLNAGQVEAAGLSIPDNFLFGKSGREVYYALSFEAARRVAMDAKNFSNEEGYGETLRRTFGKTLMSMDGSEHAQMKKLVLPSFSHRVVNEDFVHMAEPIIAAALDQIVPHGRGELVSQFMAIFPFQIIASIFGVPSNLASEAEELMVAATSMGKDPERALAALDGMNAMYQRIVDDHRISQADDLVTALMNTRVDGEQLSDEEIVAFLKQIVAAGLDTTARQTANLVYLLLEHPDQFDDLRANPDLLENAIFEGMRFESAGGFSPRVALHDTEVEGVLIPKGAGVYAVIHGANRDPKRWTDPDIFDIRRPRKQFMTFGAGAHACLGANLTIAEQKIAMEGVLRRLTNLRKDPERWDGTEIRGYQLRSATKLPVLWDR